MSSYDEPNNPESIRYDNVTQGPTTTIFPDGNLWRWTVESAPQGCLDFEAAKRQTRAATDAIDLLD